MRIKGKKAMTWMLLVYVGLIVVIILALIFVFSKIFGGFN